MNPKHIEQITDLQRRAIAPYNFVELPDQVITAKLPLPDSDRYHSKLHTGRIECTLTTASPLYIRCGLTTEEFQGGKEAKDLPDFFYTDPAAKAEKPVLPGSSLRGMLRNLVEIVSFSKIDHVSEYQKLFFRSVAGDKPLQAEYDQYLGKSGRNVKAGYLKKQGNQWFIRPAMPIGNAPFVWVKEKTAKAKIPGLILMEQLSDYCPQYVKDINFDDIYTDNGRKFAGKVSKVDRTYNYKGILVTSGNMLEGASKVGEQKRTNHCLIREADPEVALIPIDEDAIQDYRNALTPFQKEPPFHPEMGVLKNDRPIFYCQPKFGKPVKLFGQSPNFRIPYIPKGKTKAASAADFIPDNLQDVTVIDLADAIFGWIRREDTGEQLPEGTEKQRAGRVFISDAYTTSKNDIWYQGNPDDTVAPQILASPKPTTFQHYLVQPTKTNAQQESLKHYASEPVEETVIRGHKLYWHKGSNPKFAHPNPEEASDTQITQIKPINKGVTFKFTIHLENLSNVELGVLMWVLDIAQDDNYRLKLGMGKPLGMGAIKIEPQLYLSDRTKRYTKLFDGNNWEIAETWEKEPDYKQFFENYMLEELRQTGKFKQIPRIKMLLEMLRWQEKPSPKYLEERRYMEIERQQAFRFGNDGNEYKERPVLPSPLDIIENGLGRDRSSSPKPSKQPRPSHQQPSQQFSEGQEVDAKVTDIKEEEMKKGKKTKLRTKIFYQIEGSDCLAQEERNRQKASLAEGDVVKVTIVKVQGMSIRKVKQVTSA